MENQFKRILELVKRTGDRLVVTDPDGEHAFVVMDLAQYEDLLGLQDSWDWVDDIEDQWFEGEEEEGEPEMVESAPPAQAETPGPVAEEVVQEPNPAGEMDLKGAVEADLAIIEEWKSQSETTVSTEQKSENGQDKPKNDKIDPDEERFYLEPIE